MKANRYLLPIGLLLFFALCLVPGAQAQVRTVDTKIVSSSGITLTELNAAGAMTASFEYVITGSPAANETGVPCCACAPGTKHSAKNSSMPIGRR